jgi:hypothetical protein
MMVLFYYAVAICYHQERATPPEDVPRAVVTVGGSHFAYRYGRLVAICRTYAQALAHLDDSGSSST